MRKIFYIGLNTFRESVRSKILYSVLFFAILLVAASAMLASVTIGDQVTVIKDFGLMSISLFTVAYAVISGSALLQKELAKKTVYNILSKPVRRWEFLTGKFLGMFATSILMLYMMGVLLVLFVFMFDQHLDLALLLACTYMALELLIVCAGAIFFSTIVVTPVLSGVFTFCLFLAGRSLSHVQALMTSEGSDGILYYLLNVIYWALPQLEKLNVMNNVVYGFYPPVSHLALGTLYALFYSAALMAAATLLFRSREFN